MDAVDVLMEARAYIEKGWCRRAAAYDHRGERCDALSPEAERHCVVGAIWAGASYDGWNDVTEHAASLVAKTLGGESPAAWNDAPGRTQEDVLRVIDRAIGLGLERAGER